MNSPTLTLSLPLPTQQLLSAPSISLSGTLTLDLSAISVSELDGLQITLFQGNVEGQFSSIELVGLEGECVDYVYTVNVIDFSTCSSTSGNNLRNYVS